MTTPDAPISAAHASTRARVVFRELLRLALPIVLVQVGMMFMGVVDTMMVGRVSAQALAAVALGNLYSYAVLSFGFGTLLALDPIVSQAVGARDEPAIARAVQRGLLLAGVLFLPTAALHLPSAAILRAFRQPEELIPIAAQFTRISIPGVLGFYLFVVFRQTLQSMGRTRAIVWTIVSANFLNFGLNWLLVFGHLGLPALGPAGSAYATMISRWFMALLLLLLSWPELRHRVLPPRRDSFELRPLGRVLRLGAPIGTQYLLEFGVFGVVGLLMGWFGTNEVAGHQVALNLAALAFNVPVGISSATAVLVGTAVGRHDPTGARLAARAGLLCAVAFMSTTALLFLTLPHALAGLYTQAPGVLAVAGVLLPLAGVFQIFDGIQVVAIGILRGIGDTRTPMLVNIIGFWLLGLPVSWLLGVRWKWGPAGLWWGLVLGLMSVALVLLWRVRWRFGSALRRVAIDS